MAGPRAQQPRMPGYGVDTPSWEPLASSWTAERLHADRNCLFEFTPARGFAVIEREDEFATRATLRVFGEQGHP